MSVIDAAEKKRLQSLKEKKQKFQEREQIIQKALINVYNTTNKKIIFDEDFGEQQIPKLKEKQKVNLFEDDDANDDEDSLWNDDTFNAKKHKKVTLGHDARFTLDERFEENSHRNETEDITAAEKCDLQKEKEKELDILENVLGAPLTMKTQETKTSKKGLMIRYDPTEKKHCEYEMKPTQTEQKSTKKKKHEKTKIEKSLPVEVSKDIYYTVSDTLTESLKQNEGFSLLKTYGREKADTNVDDPDAEDNDNEDFNVSMTNNDKNEQFRFHFSAQNAFKHNSSDNEENANEIFDTDKQVEQFENDNHTNDLFGYKDTLFFENDDKRFNEAVRFFNIEAASNNEFKSLRRELKVIVRTKIRRNVRKYQPWSKKEKIKRS